MLSKKERLTRAEFNRSFSVGKRIHSSHLQIIVDQSDTFHGSVVVGKKVYKKAVDRNKLRRQLYALLYQYVRQQHIKNIFIIIAKKSAVGVPYETLRDDLYTALKKVHPESNRA